MIEQRLDAHGVLGRDRKQILDAERVELVRQILALLRIDLVHGERNRTAQFQQHLGQVAVRAGDLGAAIDQEDDVARIFQRQLGLLQDLAGNVVVVLDDDPAGVDDLEPPPLVIGDAFDPVARDPRLVADNGPALSGDAIEQCGFSYVRPTHDNDGGQRPRWRHG